MEDFYDISADENMFPTQESKKTESHATKQKDSVNCGLNTTCSNKELNFLMSQIINAGIRNGLISTKRWQALIKL